MKEITTLIIQNTQLEQFTFYNLPFFNTETMPEEKMNCFYEFEKLHHQYLVGKKKKDIFIKKVYPIDTFVIYSKEQWVVMAQIAHNRTNLEVGEIMENIIQDTEIEETNSFIFRPY